MTPAQRQRWLLITVAAGLGLLVLDRVVLTPLTDYWQHAGTEIETLRRNITAGEGSLTIADRTRARWNELQTAALPAEVAQAEQVLLSSLSQWGGQAGVELSSLKPQWKRGADARFSTLECRVDATGSLAAVVQFLHAIESSSTALRLDSVELTSRDDRGQRIGLGLVVSGLRLKPLQSRP